MNHTRRTSHTSHPRRARRTSLKSMMSAFLTETEINQSKTTYRNYAARLGLFYQFLEDKGKPLDDLGLDVMLWQKSLKDKGLKNATVRQYMVELGVFFDWCVSKEYAFKNPAAGIKTPKADPVSKDFLSESQALSLLHASVPADKKKAGKNYTRDWLMMCLMLTSGLRIDSVCRLRFRDVDFDKGELFLFHAKGDKSYAVPLNGWIAPHLKAYIHSIRLRRLPDMAYVFTRSVAAGDIDGVRSRFPVWKSGSVTYAQIEARNWSYRVCTKLTEAICGKALTAHELRHSCAAILFEKGESTQIIQNMLGHSSPMTTEKYLHGMKFSTVAGRVGRVWDEMLAGEGAI